MDWSDIGGMVAKAAPLVGSLLGGPAGGAVGSLVATALGSEATPEATAKALQADPAALERVRTLELENERELTRMHLEAETARLTQVNQTMRAEAASHDAYVRRWRPTFGYVTAFTWLLQTLALVVAVVAASLVYPERAGDIMGGLATLMGAMVTMWGIALAVLGVNVAKRSQDKQVAAGQAPDSGLLGALAKRLAG